MKTKLRRIIIISGTPGVGKTSVAKLLASRLNATLINLGELVVEEKLILNVDKKRGTFVADLERVSRRVRKLFTSVTGDVIVEGHFAVHVVPAESVTRVFVLRRNPDDLKKLLEGRGWNEAKVRENLACEVLDVCLYDAVKACGDEKVCEVDVTGKTAEAVVEEILSILSDKRKCWIGGVDWLGLFEREGRVDEFLSEF
ncbi:MAG: adenylate kinase family protein [Candidatus Bathyarchaeia archaeon]|jgi:adenylate kinase|nr:AAA family ATPase [Candidatus Bathyarchaeota archaeon A05DMB-4]MDH7595920.1 adenylate kinase family protein [Candidatus Bathyarchaeota archaeon]